MALVRDSAGDMEDLTEKPTHEGHGTLKEGTETIF
jgi:hypothetical protein